MFKLDLAKEEEPEVKLPTCIGSSKKQESSRKTSISASLAMPKLLTVWITTNCGKFLKRWDYQTHLTCLLRNLCVDQEATVGTGHGTMDWFKIRKGLWQGYVLSPCSYWYAEYIMWNARLDESQAGMKIAGGNIKHIRYAYDTTLKVEGEEELKRLLMKVKEDSEKASLKLNIQKTNIMGSSIITAWQIEGKIRNSDTFSFCGLQNHCV